MEKEKIRFAAYDGRYGDLFADYPSDLLPMISEKWNRIFKWDGQGEMPDQERKKLKQIVKRAHQTGRWVRFWATPDHPAKSRNRIWKELIEAGVDYINTDDLSGLRNFLMNYQNSKIFKSPIY